jgi:hypothetical protein
VSVEELFYKYLFIKTEINKINNAMRDMIMKPQINADQGFKLREKVFVDSPLRHFIEDELLAKSAISNEQFYDSLSILVSEFGANCRKLDVKDAQNHTFRYNNKPVETIILDEFCCEAPQVIVTTLIAMITGEPIMADEQCGCYVQLTQRIEQLLPMLTNSLSLLQQSTLQHSKVA